MNLKKRPLHKGSCKGHTQVALGSTFNGDSPLRAKAPSTGSEVGLSNPEGLKPWSVGDGVSEPCCSSPFIEGGGEGLLELEVLLLVDA